MNDKKIFFEALLKNNGQLNEIAVGENLGMTEIETRKIIAQLLDENKIEYGEYGACDYLITRRNQK